MKSEDIKVCVQ